MLSSTTDMLIEGTRNARKDTNWKHTYERKGEKARLADEMAQRNKAKLVTKTQLPEDEVGEFGTVDEILQLSMTETLMQPGTFFELRR